MVTVWHTTRHTLEQPSSYEKRGMAHFWNTFRQNPRS